MLVVVTNGVNVVIHSYEHNRARLWLKNFIDEQLCSFRRVAADPTKVMVPPRSMKPRNR